MGFRRFSPVPLSDVTEDWKIVPNLVIVQTTTNLIKKQLQLIVSCALLLVLVTVGLCEKRFDHQALFKNDFSRSPINTSYLPFYYQNLSL